MKSNDLAALGKQFSESFKWIACGLGTAPPFASRSSHCKPGQVPIYASYWAFRSAVAHGVVRPGETVLFDQEGWVWTPKREQEHPDYYLKLAGELASSHQITIIMSPVERGWSAEIAAEVAAAPYASVVEIQSQRLDGNPAAFRRYVGRAVTEIRAANPTVTIVAGLATDAGGNPVSAGLILREYHSTYPIVDGFWLNADQWKNGRGCATTGCGLTADRFLAQVLPLSS